MAAVAVAAAVAAVAATGRDTKSRNLAKYVNKQIPRHCDVGLPRRILGQPLNIFDFFVTGTLTKSIMYLLKGISFRLSGISSKTNVRDTLQIDGLIKGQGVLL